MFLINSSELLLSLCLHHLSNILFEMIFRKKVPQKYEAAVHAVGMALLLLLMAVVSFKDIWMLITG